MRASSDPSYPLAGQLAENLARPAREKVRALLIDDDPEDRLLINRLASNSKQLDISLVCCTSTEEAAITLSKGHFDVVYVDFWMGLETTIEFINKFSRLHDAPCVLFTGLDEPDIRRLAYRAGAKGFLSKDEISSQAIESVTLAVLNSVHARN